MVFVVDFDGTCVTHEFPRIGKDIGAVPVLKKIVRAGAKIVLFTMRDDRGPGEMYLTDAVNWFKENGIELYGIQTNPSQKSWTNSPKAHGDVFIDDLAFGCPLVFPEDGSRPYVDWKEIESVLFEV